MSQGVFIDVIGGEAFEDTPMTIHTPRTDKLADRYGEIDPDSPYWAALNLATELEGVNAELLEALITADDELSEYSTLNNVRFECRKKIAAAIKKARHG